jgi:molybdate transport system substrate-binding protein
MINIKKILLGLTMIFVVILTLYSLTATNSQDPQQLLILSASSTTPALRKIAEDYKNATGTPVKISSASSNVLAQQISAGVSAQIYLSAHPRWAEFIENKNMCLKRKFFLSNQLVIVVPLGNPAQIHRPEDLTRKKLRHLALANKNVPVGIYAEQSLKFHNIHKTLIHQRKIVRAQNARMVLNFVENHEVEAAVVYASDAQLSKKVKIVYEFSKDSHQEIQYFLLLLKSKKTSQKALDFYNHMSQENVMKIFTQHGFSKLNTKAKIKQ